MATKLSNLVEELTNEEISCFKYHYTVDKGHAMDDRSVSIIKLEDNGQLLAIYNKKTTEQDEIEWVKSNASLKV